MFMPIRCSVAVEGAMCVLCVMRGHNFTLCYSYSAQVSPLLLSPLLLSAEHENTMRYDHDPTVTDF